MEIVTFWHFSLDTQIAPLQKLDTEILGKFGNYTLDFPFAR